MAKGPIKFELFAPYNEDVNLVGSWNNWQPILMRRDDKGYWNHLETYLKQHADLDFSHSICPNCMEKQLKQPH